MQNAGVIIYFSYIFKTMNAGISKEQKVEWEEKKKKKEENKQRMNSQTPT